MGSALFYHLTEAPLEQALLMLLGKARQAGWRVAVRGVDAERLDWLDKKLWLAGDESFLPHGRSGGPHDALQPILLTTGQATPNRANCVMSIDGAPVTANEVTEFDRVCILFDGNTPGAVDVARDQWRDLSKANCHAQYWAQEDGKWVMKTETGG